MALIMDQQRQSNFKHFCKICKKGFMCGRALGGHMRAHGIGDEGVHLDDEDPVSDWEDHQGDAVPPGAKRMYALRTNPNRLKSCRVCKNCSKEFSSWKSFLEHGKCTSEDMESLVSSHDSDDEEDIGRRGYGWSKRKRSLRVKIDDENSTCPSSEEENLANCLMMLSKAKVDPSMAEPEESCASASKDEERRKPINFVSPFSYRMPSNTNTDKAKGVSRGLFECKACKKVFNSHQALGGHRASHKKVKGCFAARLDAVDDYVPDDDVITHEEFIPNELACGVSFDHRSNPLIPSTSKRKSKVHECSICHRVFSSGQALGGHKRCHWITSNSPDTNSLAKLQKFHDDLELIQQRPKLIDADPLALKLDLNVPPTSDDRRNTRNQQPAGYQLSTRIYLQSWLGVDGKEREAVRSQQQVNTGKECKSNKNDEAHNNVNDNRESNVDDEDENKAKIAKLSELKDMNASGGSSWLQMGIGPMATAHHHHEDTPK
ncbi:hypothetical protein SAY86_030168 [Trapa natans]|uniref:C2H2-type domain-containing protein n=1 Tax=Trapa natans TaxID=22666 RepID=A0AAN7MFM5_TRANT|nr:hypothetical protein SAY86_030168 [Trapa natans]